MQHLAIIPDGNRRWAAQHKMESFLGHKNGLSPVQAAIKVCIKNGIKFLTFYTFSLENFRRGESEKSYLFDLLSSEIHKQLPELIKNGIRIRFLGDRSQFPSSIVADIQEVEEQTKHLSTLNVSLLFCYGATAEITSAVRTLAKKVKDGIMGVDEINEQVFRNELWTADIPDPELIIRAGGLCRLSNFLLFQAAYSEFSFLDCLWPDVTELRIEQCLADFSNAKRNFGR